MKTVKQVSDFTGISIRTLQYYDEIGLLKPSRVTEAGYRMYDDESLEVLQQILFYKELGFQLKDIKQLLQNPNYDKTQALMKQRALILMKQNRLGRLLELLDRLIKGEKCMSFKEFDMSEYLNILEVFKENNTEEIIKYWGGMDEFNKMTDIFKDKEAEIAQMAIKQYGSIEKYTEAMKKNLENFPETMEKLDSIKDNSKIYIERNNALMNRLTADLSKDVASDEIREIIEELMQLFQETSKDIDMGENFWKLTAEGYLTEPKIIEVMNQKYGRGASNFIGKAFLMHAV